MTERERLYFLAKPLGAAVEVYPVHPYWVIDVYIPDQWAGLTDFAASESEAIALGIQFLKDVKWRPNYSKGIV